MPEKTSTKSQATKADQTLRDHLNAFVEKHGEKEAIELLGMSRQTLSRLMAGQSVRRGSLALARTELDRLAMVNNGHEEASARREEVARVA